MSASASVAKPRVPRAPRRQMRSSAKRSGLRVGVSRIMTCLRAQMVTDRMSETAKITAAAMYQTVLERLFEASIRAKPSKKKMLKPEHIRRAVTEDPALRDLFGDHITFVGGGVRRMVIPRAQEPHGADIDDLAEVARKRAKAAEKAKARAAAKAQAEAAAASTSAGDDDTAEEQEEMEEQEEEEEEQQ